jgi:serine/threonine protein phosphatase PrpC
VTVLRSGSATDVGRVRTSNQDVALEDPDLFAVADGMGGHVGGEVAARVAVDTLRAAFQRQPTVEGLRRAVAEANRAVWRQGQAERGLRGMGTTLTATALVTEEPHETEGDSRQVIALANVGDSRAYVFSKGQLIQVTADHSLAEEKVRQGQLTEAEAAVHPHRHILTRALGVSSDVDVDLWELHLHAGDRILLCSDGLTNELGDDRIGEILGTVGDPRGAAKALVQAALEHGGNDNITSVVVDVVSAEGPSPSRPAAAGVAAGLATGAGEAEAGGDSTDATGGDGAGGQGAGERGAPSRDPVTAAVAGASAGGTLRRPPTGNVTVAPEADRGAPPAPDGGVPADVNGAGGSSRNGSATLGPTGAGGAPPPRGLQAAELRRWQTSRRERRHRQRMAGMPRLVTFRVVLFFVLLAAVVAGGYALVRWYAMDDWYVGVHDSHLAVYQGRPGGFLWFKPKLLEVTRVGTGQILPFTLPVVQHDKQEPSLGAAQSYVRNLHQEYVATHPRSKGATGPSSTTSTTTTTTTAPTG